MQPGLHPGVEKFLTARRAAGYTQYLSVMALDPLLGYLGATGVVLEPVPPMPTPAESLIERCRAHLTGERGLVRQTARNYVQMVTPFVDG